MTIRVLRVLEYEYEDEATMIRDMEKWSVGANAVHVAGKLTIRSATIQPHFADDKEKKV